MISHVSGESKLEELCDLRIRSLWGFSKVVRQIVPPWKAIFSEYVNLMVFSFVSLLCMLGWCLREVQLRYVGGYMYAWYGCHGAS